MTYQIIKRKAILIPALLMALISFAILFDSDRVARFSWNYLKIPLPAGLIKEDANLALSIGNYYFRWGEVGRYDIDKAEEFYNRALQIDRNMQSVWYQLGRIDFLHGRFRSAVFKLNKQLSLYGDVEDGFYFNTYYVRGLTYGYMNMFELAEKDFMHMIELQGEDVTWAAYVDLAWVYFRQSKFEEMLEITSRGMKLHSENAWVLNMHGLALLNNSRDEEAKMVLKRALEMAGTLTEEDWSRSYPGNDPRIAEAGLEEMLEAIKFNLALVNN